MTTDKQDLILLKITSIVGLIIGTVVLFEVIKYGLSFFEVAIVDAFKGTFYTLPLSFLFVTGFLGLILVMALILAIVTFYFVVIKWKM